MHFAADTLLNDKELSHALCVPDLLRSQEALHRSPEALTALEACQGYDEKLKDGGPFVMSEALELPEGAMTVQIRDGKTSSTDGPFMETNEMPGGLIVIDARDLNETVRLAAGHPLAKIGSIEVSKVVDFSEPPPEL
jgi:hypothetical protein